MTWCAKVAKLILRECTQFLTFAKPTLLHNFQQVHLKQTRMHLRATVKMQMCRCYTAHGEKKIVFRILHWECSQSHLHLLLFSSLHSSSQSALSHLTIVSQCLPYASLRSGCQNQYKLERSQPLRFPPLQVHLTSTYNWCHLYFFFIRWLPASRSISHVKRVQGELCLSCLTLKTKHSLGVREWVAEKQGQISPSADMSANTT